MALSAPYWLVLLQNGYGTVEVDLAAEAAKLKETMKALRASQMNKPPPQAMKLNKVRTSTIHPQPLNGQRLKELR